MLDFIKMLLTSFAVIIFLMMLTLRVQTKSSRRIRKRRRQNGQKRKKTTIHKSHLTKHFKAPNSCFKMPSMAVQRKKWHREDKKLRIRQDIDNERPKWLLNINGPEDIDDQRPKWLVNLSEEVTNPSKPSRPLLRLQDKLQKREHQLLTKSKRQFGVYEWCLIASQRRRVNKNGPKWRIFAYEQASTLLCIIALTIESQKPEEEFSFHSRQIFARLKIQFLNNKLEQIYFKQLMNWGLGQYKFNSTLGYPGEGPTNCGKCGQPHSSGYRASKCKCLRKCDHCSTIFQNLQDHTITEHKGWECEKCHTKHASKRSRDRCTCTECSICSAVVHNMKEHNRKEHNNPLSSEQKERHRKSMRKMRANRSPEEKAQENAAVNEMMKDRRASDKSPEKRFECIRCSKKFRYKHHCQKCACKLCEHCSEWTRDINKHIRVEHPEEYFKPKKDVYRSLRMDCIRGVIALLKMYE